MKRITDGDELNRMYNHVRYGMRDYVWSHVGNRARDRVRDRVAELVWTRVEGRVAERVRGCTDNETE